jgi:hypothetical protein
MERNHDSPRSKSTKKECIMETNIRCANGCGREIGTPEYPSLEYNEINFCSLGCIEEFTVSLWKEAKRQVDTAIEKERQAQGAGAGQKREAIH